MKLPKREDIEGLLRNHGYDINDSHIGSGVHLVKGKHSTFTVGVTSHLATIHPDYQSKKLDLPSRFGAEEIDDMDEIQFILMRAGFFAHRSALNSVHVAGYAMELV